MKTPGARVITTLQIFEPAPDAVYSIEAAARLTRIPRRRIALYCRHQLVAPVTAPDSDGWLFDEPAIRTLRLIEKLRESYGLNVAGLQFIAELLRDREHLRAEIRFLRR